MAYRVLETKKPFVVNKIWRCKGQGRTLLVTGSHKALYTAPPEIQNPKSDIWSTFGCPPGSLLFFTEVLTHSANPWTN